MSEIWARCPRCGAQRDGDERTDRVCHCIPGQTQAYGAPLVHVPGASVAPEPGPSLGQPDEIEGCE